MIQSFARPFKVGKKDPVCRWRATFLGCWCCVGVVLVLLGADKAASSWQVQLVGKKRPLVTQGGLIGLTSSQEGHVVLGWCEFVKFQSEFRYFIRIVRMTCSWKKKKQTNMKKSGIHSQVQTPQHFLALGFWSFLPQFFHDSCLTGRRLFLFQHSWTLCPNTESIYLDPHLDTCATFEDFQGELCCVPTDPAVLMHISRYNPDYSRFPQFAKAQCGQARWPGPSFVSREFDLSGHRVSRGRAGMFRRVAVSMWPP